MKIFSLQIPKLSYTPFFSEITSYLMDDGRSGKSIFTPNPEICLETLHDDSFRDILQKSDYLTSDGIGLYIGYQIQDSHLPKILQYFLLPIYISNIIFRKRFLYRKYGDRICGSDLTNDLLYFCENKNMQIAVVDGYFPNDVEKVKSQETFLVIMKEHFPDLEIDYYILKDNSKAGILQQISQSNARIVFCTLGMKKQEYFISGCIDTCQNIRLGLGVGSSFDYFTGFQKRAPKIWRDIGLEWLYRIFTSPNKLKRIKRVFRAVIIFPITVIQHQ